MIKKPSELNKSWELEKMYLKSSLKLEEPKKEFDS